MSPLANPIVCVECGGSAFLLTTFPPDEPPIVGDVVAYRCGECMDRFDLVVDEADLEEDDPRQ